MVAVEFVAERIDTVEGKAEAAICLHLTIVCPHPAQESFFGVNKIKRSITYTLCIAPLSLKQGHIFSSSATR